MRASISFCLALLLAVTPILQVHGQARQQGPSPPDSSAAIAPPTADARSLVFLEPAWAPWVPTLEASNPADRLLAPGVAGPWDATDSRPVLLPREISTPAKVGIIVGVFLVVSFLVLLAVCSNACG